MTTITTGTQRPQKSLIVLIGLAITAVAVAATVAVSQPTATTEPAEAVATEPAPSLAASDEQLVRGTTGLGRLPDSIADAKGRASAGTVTPTAPLPDSIADAQDRAAAWERIAEREAAAEAVGGPVADAILGGSSVDAGIMAQAEALEEAVQNGGQPGVVAPVKPPLFDGSEGGRPGRPVF